MIRLTRALERMLGLETISDELLEDAIARVKVRCAAVDLSMYKIDPAEARLATEAVEAIIGAFRDHNPSANVRIRDDWPHVNVSLMGQSARFKIWLGQDYNNHSDGIERFDVHCASFQPQRDFGSVVRRMLQRASGRRLEPEIVLRTPVAPKRPEPPRPTRPEPSRRATIDANKRK